MKRQLQREAPGIQVQPKIQKQQEVMPKIQQQLPQQKIQQQGPQEKFQQIQPKPGGPGGGPLELLEPGKRR
ncbi:MAG: hypothetical protein LDL33_15640 [Desulfomonile sp.]|nr:hypothetical protein [Desulfomonile sp.]